LGKPVDGRQSRTGRQRGAIAARVVVCPTRAPNTDMPRAFVRDLSDASRYYCLTTRLSDSPGAIANALPSSIYFGLLALVADVGATMIGEARYTVYAGDAAGASLSWPVPS
jgi:hypothetical protein